MEYTWRNGPGIPPPREGSSRQIERHQHLIPVLPGAEPERPPFQAVGPEAEAGIDRHRRGILRGDAELELLEPRLPPGLHHRGEQRPPQAMAARRSRFMACTL